MGEAFGHFQARLGQGAFEVPLEFQKDEIVLLALDRHDIVDVPDAGLDVAVGDGVDFYGVLVGDAAGEQKARRKQGVQAGPWKRHGYGPPGGMRRCRVVEPWAASGIPPWAGFCSGRDGGTLRGCLGVTCGWAGRTGLRLCERLSLLTLGPLYHPLMPVTIRRGGRRFIRVLS